MLVKSSEIIKNMERQLSIACYSFYNVKFKLEISLLNGNMEKAGKYQGELSTRLEVINKLDISFMVLLVNCGIEERYNLLDIQIEEEEYMRLDYWEELVKARSQFVS